MNLLKILGVFSFLSFLAIGGGTSVLPEMKTVTTVNTDWLTNPQFRDVFGISQLAPGPKMLMVAVIGYKVAGIPGGLVAFFAFFVPCSILSVIVAQLWDRFEKSPWRTSIESALAPIVIGLMLAGIIALSRTALLTETTRTIALIVFMALYFGEKKISPVLLILGGGGAGWYFLR